ncbi:MAG: glycosyltransferase family 4 protein [Ruminococcus flavefaciens]|nr:glycosyltransferase family 4 protein [Ruminococcus flavefaciens]
MKKIYIFTPGSDPIPPINGGGVENVIMSAIRQNEKHHCIKIIVYSLFDERALEESCQYSFTEFRFMKVNKFIQLLDRIIWAVTHNVFGIDIILFRNLLQRFVIICKTHLSIGKIVKKEKDCSIIIEHSILLLFSLLGINKKSNKIYFHAHNRIEHNYKFLNHIIEELDGVISVSKYLQHSNKQLYARCNKQFILKNGVEKQRFAEKHKNSVKYKELLHRYNPDNKRIILFIGRIDEQKGVLETVRAFQKLSRNDVRLLICGSVFYRKNVHSKYEKLIIDEVKNADVVFTGFIDYDEVSLFYEMAYLCVLPSKCEEAAGLVMIESMMSGTPLITTKRGGIPEYVKDGCRFVPVDDNMVAALAKKWKKY